LRSHSDPLRRAQRQRTLTWVASACAVAACGWFALGPVAVGDLGTESRTAKEKPTVTPPAPDPFDARAFNVALWNPTEARKLATGAASGAASRPATRFQLVGITEDKGVLRAALFDPDGDRLWIVGNGDTIPGQRVEKLTASEVVLVGNSGTTRLALRRERP
jgi:hypothetical protein